MLDRVARGALAALERRPKPAPAAAPVELLVPQRVLESFYTKHGEQAALPQQYPGSVLVKDTLAIQLVESYSTPLRGRTLAALGSRWMAQYGHAFGRQVSVLF